MKKITFLIITLLQTCILCAQPDATEQNTNTKKLNVYDSTYRAFNFISKQDAERIINKTAVLKDSSFKHTMAMLRYSFDYIAVYKDSTSKGKIFFSFESYNETATAKQIYESIKTENEKSAVTSALSDIGEEAFMVKDTNEQPFMVIRKENRLMKFKLYYLTDKRSLEELMKVAKKVATAH